MRLVLLSLMTAVLYGQQPAAPPGQVKPPAQPGVVRQLMEAQPQVLIASFSPGQKLSKGYYEWTVTTCNHSLTVKRDLHAGVLVEAAIFGRLPVQPPSEVRFKLIQDRNRTFPVMGADVGAKLGQLGTVLGAGRVIAMSSQALTGLAVGTLIVSEGVSFLKSRQMPDFDTRFPAGSLLTGIISLPPGYCDQDRVLFTKGVKHAQAFQVQVP